MKIDFKLAVALVIVATSLSVSAAQASKQQQGQTPPSKTGAAPSKATVHKKTTATPGAKPATAVVKPFYSRTKKGVLYHIFKSGDIVKIKQTDVITFNFIQKTGKDSLLTSSYANGGPIKMQIQPSQNIGDLMDIFPMLAAKDSAVVKVPTDSLFKGHEESRPPFLRKGSFLVFNIKIERVQSLADAIAERNAQMKALQDAETTAITKYIADQKLNVTATPSGLNYVITKPSEKDKPLKGDTVLVNYVGHTLEGKVFDTSVDSVAKKADVFNPGRSYEPLKLTLGQQQVIQGWEEGLLLLNEGSKATFIIPSSLAYGERGAGNDIRPFTPLVFELELVKIKHPVKP